MNKKEIPRSFRVDPVLDERIKQEAEKQDIKIGTLLYNIVRSYFDRNWYKKIFKS